MIYRNSLCGVHDNDMRRFGTIVRPALRRTCLTCGEALHGRTNRQRVCSQRCRLLASRYRLSPNGFRALTGTMACDGCFRPGRYGGRSGLHVDHDHTSGVVRGALHTGCNTALGPLREDPTTMTRLAAYLESVVAMTPSRVPSTDRSLCPVCGAAPRVRNAGGRPAVYCGPACRRAGVQCLRRGIDAHQHRWLKERAAGMCEACSVKRRLKVDPLASFEN